MKLTIEVVGENLADLRAAVGHAFRKLEKHRESADLMPFQTISEKLKSFGRESGTFVLDTTPSKNVK